GSRRADQANEVRSVLAAEIRRQHAIIGPQLGLVVWYVRCFLELVGALDVQHGDRHVADVQLLDPGDLVNGFAPRREEHAFPALQIVVNAATSTLKEE